MKDILYIICHRHRNHDRTRNLYVTLSWIKLVAQQLFKLSNGYISLDVLVVEQDNSIKFNHELFPWVKYQFIHNDGIFNKGWGFNVGYQLFPKYSYYAFADNDLICPDIDKFCNLISHHIKHKTKAFRPFSQCLDTTHSQMDKIFSDALTTELSDSNTYNKITETLFKLYEKGKLDLTNRQGINLAGGLVFIKRRVFRNINGWDENFKGWGRHDDFMTHTLLLLGECENIYGNVPFLHLWHPITLDFSLNQEAVLLYDRLIKLDKQQLKQVLDDNTKHGFGHLDKYNH